MKYPNILIVTSVDIFADCSSSSMTVKSFFEEIPLSNIFQLVCTESDGTSRGNYGNNYYLNRKDISLFPKIKRKKNISGIIQPIDNQIASKSLNIKNELYVLAKDIISFLPYKVSKGLLSFIVDAKIDIIYTCSFNPRCYRLIEKISSKIKIPHVAHFLDDWPNIQYVGSWGSKIFRKSFHRNLLSFIHNSPFTLCISELMCKEYQKTYHYDRFYPLMHSVDQVPFVEVENCTIKKIVYAGSLYLERYISILEFCKFIKKHGLDGKFEVVLFTHQKQWDELAVHFKNYAFVKYGGFVNHDKLMEEIQKSYALLFVESLKEEMLLYTRLSMSTKIPEFLSSGKPIFAIGNSKQGSISYLQEHKAAYIVNDLLKMDKVVNDFIGEYNLKNIIYNAKNLYLQNHQKVNQKEFFLSLINNSLGHEK